MSREEFLRTIIEDRYGSLRAFTKNIGMPYTTLVSILKRGIGNTSVDNILKICKHLGIPPESLYEDDIFFQDKSNITLIRNITQLSAENKKLVFDYINFLKNSTHTDLEIKSYYKLNSSNKAKVKEYSDLLYGSQEKNTNN
ncbi:helix-turn-helix domain-containing protein [Ligilactobacillus salivarius]|uniref:helix-turn-helix domain-containing protein n=1 Tax=Ligilactobacillus salivarius TaxID=1624 RepID=UPI0001DD319C|nr:helix-turn-helix transcriptional regulator [Ligilactobacillus salivarius]EFK80490.1 putative toxin-antitoxin system, antitoxin component, Xre family [Ligilactobacillus salivarius ACS-116-V-Col5a]MBZ4029754.1 helix-turn-helix domain-containing protein [Ligilactobacillus salivarius]MYV15729.1 helix-turn-helix transcriptional regulator [Ligilactobacillus salivarius]MYY23223.1 helix-turn-helix transcriptional regulator [Ligilactobacillus salivarius]MYY40066.1 helix-turn-helix transcriptional re